MRIGYFVVVTESERGWGTRPDGYVIALSRIALDSKMAAMREHDQKGSGEYISIFGEVCSCVINAEYVAKIEANEEKAIWLDGTAWKIADAEPVTIDLLPAELERVISALHYHYDGVEGAENEKLDAENKATVKRLKEEHRRMKAMQRKEEALQRKNGTNI